ncbi:MAG: hypothetical protein IT233_06940 [Bacteroidia bacterium]|nr:hypothetical protein [Bacteroidia bacterium]
MRQLLVVILLLPFLSCRKEKTPELIVSELRVHAEVIHHTYAIPYSRVYLKSGTTVWPGNSPSFYETSLITDAGGRVTFAGLSGGKYVFWAVGYDAAVADSVSGYMVISSSLDPGEQKEVNLIIPVSE